MATAKCFSQAEKKTSKNSDDEIVVMKFKKHNHKETLITEVTAWAFVIGIIYLLIKAAL